MTRREAAGLAARTAAWAADLDAMNVEIVNGVRVCFAAEKGRDSLTAFLRQLAQTLVDAVGDEPLILTPNPKETP